MLARGFVGGLQETKNSETRGEGGESESPEEKGGPCRAFGQGGKSQLGPRISPFFFESAIIEFWRSHSEIKHKSPNRTAVYSFKESKSGDILMSARSSRINVLPLILSFIS